MVRLCLVLGAGLLTTLTACGQTTVTVRRGEKLNPSPEGDATPVTIRIHQLQSKEKFKAAGFEDMWIEPKKVLGDDLLLAPADKTVLPKKKGGEADFTFVLEELQKIDSRMKYLGIAVLFTPEDLDDKAMAKWKIIVFKDQLGDNVFFVDKYELKFIKR